MNHVSTAGAGLTMTPAQYLATMGAALYCPALRQRLKPGMLTAAMGFDKLVNLAERRGFTERRLLKAGLRTGKVGPAAMSRCEAVAALLQPDEVEREVALASQWLELVAGHRQQPQGRA